MSTPKLYYISRNYKFSKNAASKPKMDCEHILAGNGFRNLGFSQSNHPSSALGALISFFGISWGLVRLPFSSVLCMQYPLSKYYNYKIKWAKLKGCKVILIVHDVKTLMGKNRDARKEMKRFNRADVLILHNPEMMKWFVEQGYRGKMVSLELFDYLLAMGQELPEMPRGMGKGIVFAGGLGMEKSAFLYQMDGHNFSLNLFGNGFQGDRVGPGTLLNYRGSFAPDEVLNHLKGDFGLVWNGNSTTECDGAFGRYIRYNNPHKTSLYLLAGLPIIIWEKAAVARVVEAKKLGISIASLGELSEKLAQIDAVAYGEMVANVQEIRHKIASGHFLGEAIGKALAHLGTKHG